MDNSDLDDVYQAQVEKKESQDSTFNTAIRKLETKHLLFIFGAVVFLYYMVSVKQAMTFTSAALYFAIVLGVIWLMAFQDQPVSGEPLDYHEAVAVLRKKLTWLQKQPDGGVPEGLISIGLASKHQFIDGKAWKWNIYFEMHPREGLPSYWTAEMHPFTGRIIAYKERPEGFTGREPNDLKYIRRQEDVFEQKYFKTRRPGGP